MKLKDFLQTLLNAPELVIRVNKKQLSYDKHIQDLNDCPNAESEIIMWQSHHSVIEIWVVDKEKED